MANNNRGFGDDSRSELRKRKRMNRILNAAIGVVAVLIIFFAVQLLMSGDDEEVADDTENEQVDEQESSDENDNSDSEEESSAPDSEPDTNDNTEQESPSNNNDNNDNNEEANREESSEDDDSEDSSSEEEDSSSSDEDTEEQEDSDNEEGDSGPQVPEGGGPDGDWEPIGTEQSGSYSHTGDKFEKGSQNWTEMEMALQYATGLSDDEMILWRVENSGETEVVGTVSNNDNRNTPYEVRMEFVEGEGWQPQEVSQLDSNPYS
ncbi:DUF1510 family protein [Alteribacillus sp. HJP-4]|uniref:YrrS family protein n=1 Tax=Alteribacillus sp. HJP-4 TaxID=2775394 RepID=UPI0035CD0381